MVINVNVRPVLIPPVGFTLQAIFSGGFPVVNQVFQYGPVEWIHWEDFHTGVDLFYVGIGDPGPWITEEQVVLRLGHYDRLPADFCQL